MRGDVGGLCIDCHDECEWSGDGYEAAVRAELAATRWYIQKGENHWEMPGPCPTPGFSQCPCERHRFMLFLVGKYGWA